MSFTESVDELVAADESGLLGIHPTWVRVRMAEVCSILNGFPFSSKQFKPGGGTPLIRIRDIVRGRTDTHFVGDFDPAFIVRHGELVVGMDGDFNCARWSGDDALLNQRVCKLTPDERHYDLRLLGHALPGYLGAINSKTSAITVKHLSSKTVAEIPLPLPPRREQARLAEALDSYFTRLDDAVATLERVQRNLKRYRASVLKAAVEGRLVPTEAELARAEGRSYEPAPVLLTRILAERRRRWEEAELAKMTAKGKAPKDEKWKAKYVEPVAPDTSELPELPEGWCWATVDQLAVVGTGATPKRGNARFWTDGEVPWVTSAVVNDSLVTTPSEFVTRAALRDTNLTLYPPGTVLVAMYGEGKTRGRATTLGIEATTNQALAALVLPGTGDQLRSWLLRFLEHNYLELRRAASGGVQPNLNLGILRAICVPLPPLAEQRRASEAADRSLSIANASDEAMTANEVKATRLRQSILKWAFEGYLVDQDPTDESASVLLERIRAERASVTDTPPRRARRANARVPKS